MGTSTLLFGVNILNIEDAGVGAGDGAAGVGAGDGAAGVGVCVNAGVVGEDTTGVGILEKKLIL
tara:strand:- start:16823 stop:17014 length:192 start_codon:yes stop_codon:yes gene_type:complete